MRSRTGRDDVAVGSRQKTWPWVSREDGWPHPSERRRPQISAFVPVVPTRGRASRRRGGLPEPTCPPPYAQRPRRSGRRARPARQLPSWRSISCTVCPVVRAASTEGSDCRWKRDLGLSPRLSVCCATADPGARVAEALRPFREVADEIVVAVDSRLDLLGSRLRTIADMAVRFEFAPPIERAWSWLSAQMSGDWIFRLDGDEVASPALDRRASSPDRGRRRPPVLDSETRVHPDGRWFDPGRGGRASSADSYETTSGFTDGLSHRPRPTAAGPVRGRNCSTTCSTPARWCATDGRRWRTTRESTRHFEGGRERSATAALLPEDYARLEPVAIPRDDLSYVEAWLRAGDATSPTEASGIRLFQRAEIDGFWAQRRLEDPTIEQPSSPSRDTVGCGPVSIDRSVPAFATAARRWAVDTIAAR